MTTKAELQRRHLNELAATIREREAPLGVGLRHHCWAGVAIDLARAEGVPATEYFGLAFAEMRRAIKLNNFTPAARRNEVMLAWTERMALRPA